MHRVDQEVCLERQHESEGVMEGRIASQEQPDIFEVSIIGDSGGPGRQQQKVGR